MYSGKEYLDPNGAHVFVSSGISAGTAWMTVRQKAPGKGTHQISSPALPIRDTPEEAQQDLDAYAVRNGWKEAGHGHDSPGANLQQTGSGATPERRIRVCSGCIQKIRASFPFYAITEQEGQIRGKCGHCHKQTHLTEYKMERRPQ